MVLFSRKLFSECMCFPLKCRFDEDAGLCMLSQSSTQRNTSNPMSHIPTSGYKCVTQSRRADKKKCILTPCDNADVATKGPTVGGKQLFGQVGRHGEGL